LGNYTKEEVKKIAQDNRLILKDTGESQDVCFVKDKCYTDFIEENISDYAKYAGDIKYIKGGLLGRHKGIYRYTYGQRGGLGISWPRPLYVIAINKKTKTVVAGEKEFLYRDSFFIKSLNWFFSPKEARLTDWFSSFVRVSRDGKISRVENIKVKVRYNSNPHNCSLEVIGNKVKVRLREKISGVAPGQVAAFYYRDLLLGGGIILR